MASSLKYWPHSPTPAWEYQVPRSGMLALPCPLRKLFPTISQSYTQAPCRPPSCLPPTLSGPAH